MNGNDDLKESYQKAKESNRILSIKRNHIQNWPCALQNIMGMIFLLSLILLIGHCNQCWQIPFMK
jgi:hypothetical protein